MSERHALFFGLDPKQPEWPSHQRALVAHGVQGNYRLICGHCGVTLMGEVGHPGGITKILWTHDGSSWFGRFQILEEPDTPLCI